ncbi:MAG: hypothetical protein MJ252_11470 [archaeon]|nr:hypothetical protein [archaeon]
MTDLKGSSSNLNKSLKSNKEEEPKVENKCQKCNGNKRQFDFSCGHKLCLDCLLSFFISSNLSNLTLDYVEFNCTICQKGIFTISLEEWGDILNETNEEQKERNRYMEMKSKVPQMKCFNHKDEDVVGYCVNCKLWLCHKCKELFHNQYYPDHEFSMTEDVNIFCETHPQEIAVFFCLNCQRNICKLCTNENEYHSQHRYITQTEYKQKTIKNNGETSLTYQNFDEFETYMDKYVDEFNQKLEDDYIKKKAKIDEMIQKLQGLEMEYQHQTENFRIKMNNVFSILKLTYFLYFTGNEEEKQKVKFQSSLTDISLVSKRKADLDELFCGLMSQISEFEKKENPEQNPEIISTLGFQFVWNNNSVSMSKILNEDKNKNKGQSSKTGSKAQLDTENSSREQNEAITKILLLNDPNFIAAASVDKSIVIYDIFGGEEPKKLEGHTSSVWSLCQDKNGRLFSGSSDKTIRVWESVETGGYCSGILKGHKGTIFSLENTKDNKLVSGSNDNTIKFWEMGKKGKFECIFTFNLGATTNCIGILVDNFIVCGCNDNEIKAYDIKNKEIRGILEGHGCTVWALTVFTDNVHIATGSSDNSIKVWDMNNLKCEYTLEGHQNSVSAIKVLRNGMMASASWDRTIKFWNLSTKLCVCTIENAHNGNIYDLIETEDGKIITCSEDKDIKIWECK